MIELLNKLKKNTKNEDLLYCEISLPLVISFRQLEILQFIMKISYYINPTECVHDIYMKLCH